MLKIAGLLCLLCAYSLLVPGLMKPMLSVSGTVERADLVELGKQMIMDSADMPPFIAQMATRLADSIEVDGEVLVFDKTRSILETASELYASDHAPVALLILLFSVGVPVLKALILAGALTPVSSALRQRLMSIANATSKWSMADVFVIAIFVAFLAANGIQESRGLVAFSASLGDGFYYFLSYCLVSILGTQLLCTALMRTPDTSHARPATPPPTA